MNSEQLIDVMRQVERDCQISKFVPYAEGDLRLKQFQPSNTRKALPLQSTRRKWTMPSRNRRVGRECIIVPMEQDEDGYPPAGSERLWALHVGEGRYRLDNIPFFARVLALGDVVSVVPEEGAEEGVLCYH